MSNPILQKFIIFVWNYVVQLCYMTKNYVSYNLHKSKD